MVYNVRKAVLSEAPDIEEIAGESFTQENLGKYGLKYSKECSLKNISTMIKSPNYVVLVATKDEKITGFILNIVAPSIYSSDQKVMNEIGLQVSKNLSVFEGAKTLISLIRKRELFIKEMGCIFFETISTLGNSKIDKFLLKEGFDLTDKTYVRRVN